MSPNLFVISAPSGAGKTTLCARLLQRFPELKLSISTTTRAPRGAERNGIEYFFVTQEQFENDIKTNSFAEWARVHDNFYGTSKTFLQECFNQGKSVLLDIDVQGAKLLKLAYPKNTIRLFIHPPSIEVLESRLRARGTDDEATIKRRMQAALAEISESKDFEHHIVNLDLEVASQELQALIARYLERKS